MAEVLKMATASRLDLMQMAQQRLALLNQMDPFLKAEKELSERIREKYGKVPKNAILYEWINGMPTPMPLFGELMELWIQLAPLREEYTPLHNGIKELSDALLRLEKATKKRK